MLPWALEIDQSANMQICKYNHIMNSSDFQISQMYCVGTFLLVYCLKTTHKIMLVNLVKLLTINEFIESNFG